MVSRVSTDPRILHLPLFFILCGVGHVLCQTTYVETGKNYTFKTGVTTATTAPESVLWKFNSDKLVEYEDGNVEWFQFKDQGVFDIKTGVLTLDRLKRTQSGLYECEILMAGGKVDEKKYTIEVMDGVGLPTINCGVAADGQITLTCSVPDSAGPAEYDWSTPQGQFKGRTLNVSKETKPESVYYCTVINKVDKQSNQFTLKDCHSSVPVPVGLIVGCVFGTIAIAMLLIFGVVCRKNIRQYFPVSSK